MEVDTPLLTPSPAPEMHIDAYRTDGLYLNTSPELCMKRLLAAGYPKIFQVAKCFRKDERGALHLPEFTILEWYQAGIDYRVLMDQCESLIQTVSRKMAMGDRIHYMGGEILLRTPWERLTLADAFERHASMPLQNALEHRCFSELLVREVEPFLGLNRPAFVYDYPVALASLARVKQGDSRVVERFELYLGGMEVANGFSELADANEQRARFEEELSRRRKQGKEVYPMPERFLKALSKMPEAAGIALGVDRLTMLFCNKEKIDDVVCFTPEEI